MNRNVYATILIILAIGLYFTITRSILGEAGVVKASNSQYISAIESANHLISVRDKVLLDYKKISGDDRAKLDKVIPKSIDNIRLIIDLNNVGLSHSLLLKGIKASTLGAEKKVSQNSTGKTTGSINLNNQNAIDGNIPNLILDKVTVSFGVSASYQQFISFLQSLESSLRILDITHISLTAKDDGIYDWNVELQTYWLRSQ
ncbi:MAG: hypothetical protein WCS89_04010 [Candidatus Paceibacterota bacterium]|jgi:Tfp pilus assembly protein PilO